MLWARELVTKRVLSSTEILAIIMTRSQQPGINNAVRIDREVSNEMPNIPRLNSRAHDGIQVISGKFRHTL